MSVGSMARAMVWIVVVLIAFRAPGRGEAFLRKVEETGAAFARRRWLCGLSVALLVLVVRVALLPIVGIPKPYVYDEFGYILQADTFASGRLTNPSHPLWNFFESPYILTRPTYNAKFPPGQGLMLALGQILTGDPWFGVWLSCGLLAAAIFWALSEWFRPGWALFGSLVTLPLCLTSYWMNSYWGGAVAGIGGALVAGAIPKWSRGSKERGSLVGAGLFGLGAVILMATRPFEGLALLIAVMLALVLDRLPVRDWAIVATIGIAGAGGLACYNFRVTGNALRLPYIEYDRQYPSTSHFNFLPLPDPQHLRHANFQSVDHWERQKWEESRTPRFLTARFQDVVQLAGTFLGSALLAVPLFLFWPQLLGSGRLRAARFAGLAFLVTVCVEVLYYEHYGSPFLIFLLILVLEALRHLRAWKYQGRCAGRWLVGGALLAMLALWSGHEGLRILRHTAAAEAPANTHRKDVEESLLERGGTHVILVRYTRYLDQTQGEWIVNPADLDKAPVVWAQDEGGEANRRLMEYYQDRSIWLFQPDEDLSKLDLLRRPTSTRN